MTTAGLTSTQSGERAWEAARALPVRSRLGADFASTLRVARGEQPPEERARIAAEEFVASALVYPVLKMLRETNRAAPPFNPGAHEKAIGGLFDIEIATRMVRAQRFPLVDAVARHVLRSGMSADPGPQNAGGTIDGASIAETGADRGDQPRRPA